MNQFRPKKYGFMWLQYGIGVRIGNTRFVIGFFVEDAKGEGKSLVAHLQLQHYVNPHYRNLPDSMRSSIEEFTNKLEQNCDGLYEDSTLNDILQAAGCDPNDPMMIESKHIVQQALKEELESAAKQTFTSNCKWMK